MVATRCWQLKMTKPYERSCNATHNRAWLSFWVAIVKHVADNLITCFDQAQCARGWNTQMVHGLAAQKFTHRRAQYSATIGTARVGRDTCTFQLQFPALA